jgi:hypothetical protein
MLLHSSIAYTQDRVITIEKGQKTFTAVSLTASEYKWVVDGNIMTETSGTYTKDWETGSFNIAVFPSAFGCIGDSFVVRLDVKNDITIGGAQATFTQNLAEACPSSNAVPASSIVEVGIKLTDYDLQPGENYIIKYSIDDEKALTSAPFKTKDATISINTLGFSEGTHKVKITRLMYGAGYKYQLDYSTSNYIPTMEIKVKTINSIGEINF